MSSDPQPETVPAWTLLPLLVFAGVWLALALWSGVTADPRHWLAVGMVVALTALVTAVLAVYPRRPRQLSLLVLALMALYVAWSAALRAGGTAPVAGAPTARLVVVGDVVALLLVGLALAYLTDARARRWMRHLLVAAGLVLVLAVMGRLWQHRDPLAMFSTGRLSYPVGDPEGAAGVLGLLFFPLVWVAADTRERVPLRAASLATAATLLQLGVLTRSWTALAAFGGALVLTFVVSPARLRTLFYLAPVALLLVRSLPALLSYADQGPAKVGAWPATYAALITLVVGATIGLALASLESWIDVSRRMRFWFGLVTVGVAAAGLALGVSRLPPDAAATLRGWWAETAHPHTWTHALWSLPTTVLAAALACGAAGILWQRGASAWNRVTAARRARERSEGPPADELRPQGAWTISLLAAVVFWGLARGLGFVGSGAARCAAGPAALRLRGGRSRRTGPRAVAEVVHPGAPSGQPALASAPNGPRGDNGTGCRVHHHPASRPVRSPPAPAGPPRRDTASARPALGGVPLAGHQCLGGGGGWCGLGLPHARLTRALDEQVLVQAPRTPSSGLVATSPAESHTHVAPKRRDALCCPWEPVVNDATATNRDRSAFDEPRPKAEGSATPCRPARSTRRSPAQR